MSKPAKPRAPERGFERFGPAPRVAAGTVVSCGNRVTHRKAEEMARKNVTVQLDEDVIARAQRSARNRGTSLSGLVAHQLREVAERDARYEDAKLVALEALRNASRRGGRRWTRDELYER